MQAGRHAGRACNPAQLPHHHQPAPHHTADTHGSAAVRGVPAESGSDRAEHEAEAQFEQLVGGWVGVEEMGGAPPCRLHAALC